MNEHPAPSSVALQTAVQQSLRSPCQSKRGAVVYLPRTDQIFGRGYNRMPPGFVCDGSDTCKATCRRDAVHAEQMALLMAGAQNCIGCDLVHIKTLDGWPVESGGPSCIECAKMILAAGIAGVWLFEAHGWRRYNTAEFYLLSVSSVTTVPPHQCEHELACTICGKAFEGSQR